MTNFEKDAARMWQLENMVSNDNFIISIPLAKERENEGWLDWALFLEEVIAAEGAFPTTRTHFCQSKLLDWAHGLCHVDSLNPVDCDSPDSPSL